MLKKIKFVFIVSLLVALMIMPYFYLKAYEPERLDNLLLEFDEWGITEVGRKEQERLRKINELKIPFEQRQALMNRTIFLGAKKEMVLLSLGEPTITPVNISVTEQRLVYYLGDYDRPTILVLQNDILISAYQSSSSDLYEVNNPQTPHDAPAEIPSK